MYFFFRKFLHALRKPKKNEVKIPIRLTENRKGERKTYYKRVANIPKKLKTGKGQFKLVLSNRAKYLLLTFD